FNIGAHPWGSAGALHRLVEASRIAFSDRDQTAGDIYEERALDPAHVAMLATQFISDGCSTHSLGPTGSGSTTHISVVDAERNGVALTNTLVEPFGSGVTVPGLGILLNNGMRWFGPEPGSHRSVRGGARPVW